MGLAMADEEHTSELQTCALSDLVDLNIGETLEAYANRRLKELQRVSETISYQRRYCPDLYPTDVVFLSYPAQDLKGNYMISSQSITLGFNATTSEEVIKV